MTGLVHSPPHKLQVFIFQHDFSKLQLEHCGLEIMCRCSRLVGGFPGEHVMEGQWHLLSNTCLLMGKFLRAAELPPLSQKYCASGWLVWMLAMPVLRSETISRPEGQTNTFNKVINDIFIFRDRAGDAKSLDFWSQYDFPEFPFLVWSLGHGRFTQGSLAPFPFVSLISSFP